LWKKVVRSKDKAALNEYKKIRNLVRKETRNQTQKLQREIALSCKHNPKKFWQFIKSKTSNFKCIGDLKVLRADGATYM
jgi:hypothetical protein